MPAPKEWQNRVGVQPRSFTCGHCGNLVGSNTGYAATRDGNAFIYLCPYCDQPTYFSGDHQVPGAIFGNAVEHLPVDVHNLYEEPRNAVAASAFTGAVLLCRKILMNVAVSQGAPESRPFIEYVEYLADNGYVPPQGKGWVDHIRKRGNEANHEIVVMGRAEAEELISFVEMLVKFVYEFPSKVPPTPLDIQES